MKNALENIFRPTVTVTNFAVVRRRITVTGYEVEDINERLQVVEAGPNEFYPPGAKVEVQNGRIVGHGHRVGSHKIFEV